MGVLGNLGALRPFLRAEVENLRRYDIPWRRRLWLYSQGFLSSKGRLWSITPDSVSGYLSDLDQRALPAIDGPYGVGLEDKVLFHLIVSRTHEELMPTVHGLIRAGPPVVVDRSGWVGSVRELVERLDEGPFVVKPVRAAKGDDVRIADRRDGTPLLDGRPVDDRTLRSALTADRDLLVTEHVQQADYAAAIYPGATNTLRILTMLHPVTGSPFIATATHRFGTRRSGHVDNWGAGGVSAHVDLETGTLGEAVWQSMDGSAPVEWIGDHPDTERRIAGVEIPGWERIRSTVLDLADEYGRVWPYVGWDVVVRDAGGTIAVLEGDPKSVDADQQAHGPLLDDERVRAFYAHHGIIDPDEDRVRG